MKRVNRRLLALWLGLYAVQGVTSERLGGISDETAAPAEPAQAAEESKGGISYRVICSPEGEMLPECGQPPVKDSFAADQPKPAVPEFPASVTDETPGQPEEHEAPEAKPVAVADSKSGRKGSARKKPAKRAAKKPAKDKQRIKKLRRH